MPTQALLSVVAAASGLAVVAFVATHFNVVQRTAAIIRRFGTFVCSKVSLIDLPWPGQRTTPLEIALVPVHAALGASNAINSDSVGGGCVRTRSCAGRVSVGSGRVSQ
jgi:hypothetical protein